MTLSDKDYEFISSFIDLNELDCFIERNKVGSVYITTYDGILVNITKEDFFICTFYAKINNDDIVHSVRYDKIVDFLTWLKAHCDSIVKSYFEPITDDLTMVKIIDTNWNQKILHENTLDEEGNCIIHIPNCTHRFKSHLNFLNDSDSPSEIINGLYLEIYPICIDKGIEVFIARILINNEVVLKEYSYYKVFKYKGLNLFISILLENLKFI